MSAFLCDIKVDSNYCIEANDSKDFEAETFSNKNQLQILLLLLFQFYISSYWTYWDGWNILDSKYKQTTLVIQTRYLKLQWLLELLPPFCIAKVPLSLSYLWHRSTFSCFFSFIFVSNRHAASIIWHSPVFLSAIKTSVNNCQLIIGLFIS